MGVKTGKGWNLPWIILIDIYIIWVVTSIAGLAISPIEGDLKTIFPGSTDLEIQLITTMPSLACIPFVFLGGMLGTKFNNLWIINISCLMFFVAGCLFFVADKMWQLIALSVVAGVGAGALSPLSVTVLSNIFTGKYKTKQLGITSAMLNAVLMVAVIVTGYLAEVNWRLPFLWYLLPILPVILSPWLKKYIVEPTKQVKDAAAQKVKLNFTKECNVPMLIKCCIYYALITFMLVSTSLFIPFMMQSYGFKSGVAGDLTSVVYFGIMLSGFLLNPILGILKKTTFDMILLGILVGFGLMLISKDPIIIGCGIFIGAFFYGVGQPYAYNVCTGISTPAASSLTMAWLIIMNSVGMLLCPVVISWAQTLFHTKEMPAFPYYFMLVLAFICWIYVFGRRLIMMKKKTTHAFVFGRGKVALTALSASEQAYVLAHPSDVYDFDNLTQVATPTAATTSSATAAPTAAPAAPASATETVAPTAAPAQAAAPVAEPAPAAPTSTAAPEAAAPKTDEASGANDKPSA